MSAFTDYLENAVLNHIFRNSAYTAPGTVYIGLFTAAPGEAGGGTEVSGNGYARQSIAFNAPSSGQIDSSAQVTFPAATASWGSITHVGLFDAATNGNLLSFCTINSQTVNTGDAVVFAAGAVSVYPSTATETRSVTITAQATVTVAATLQLGGGAANYYVSTTGNDANAGTQASPWRTIQHAMNQSLQPGDIVEVANGTYNESPHLASYVTGASGSPIIFRAETRGAVYVDGGGSKYSCMRGYEGNNYIVFDGFNVTTSQGHGIDFFRVYGVEIRFCECHDCDGSGISFDQPDSCVIEDNVCYDNCKTNGYHTSGITTYQAQDIQNIGSRSGAQIIIRRNYVFDNTEGPSITSDHTDGNGIIIDDHHNGQEGGNDIIYPFDTLVECNVCFGNGGKGIQVYVSDHVRVRNNTAYRNNLDANASSTWRGEINNSQSNDVDWVNNIAVTDSSVNSNNTCMVNGSISGANSDVTWYNNLLYDISGSNYTKDGSGQGNSVPSNGVNGNILGSDPLFTNAGTGDFTLQAGSPAIDAGTQSFGVPESDNDGNNRVQGAEIDIGAYEYF